MAQHDQTPKPTTELLPGARPPAVAAPTRVLLVEDDAPLAELLADYLRESGREVDVESRGDRAVARVLAEPPALVVLDVVLPGKDGFAVCRYLRPTYAGPILMLTARGQDADHVEGLDSGADDYLTKPVRPRVLLAHVNALLRRAPPAQPARLSRGGVTLDARVRQAATAGRRLDLSRAEFDLLWLLVSHAGEALPRQVILEKLRGLHQHEPDRSIDLRVSRLRQKIAATSGRADVIRTVRGIGYEFVGVDR